MRSACVMPIAITPRLSVGPVPRVIEGIRIETRCTSRAALSSRRLARHVRDVHPRHGALARAGERDQPVAVDVVVRTR